MWNQSTWLHRHLLCLKACLNVSNSRLPREILNKHGGALNFVIKMAVYQPGRAAIATILVSVMQDDICEEFLW